MDQVYTTIFVLWQTTEHADQSQFLIGRKKMKNLLKRKICCKVDNLITLTKLYINSHSSSYTQHKTCTLIMYMKMSTQKSSNEVNTIHGHEVCPGTHHSTHDGSLFLFRLSSFGIMNRENTSPLLSTCSMELLLFTIDGDLHFDWRAHRPRSLVTDVTPTGMHAYEAHSYTTWLCHERRRLPAFTGIRLAFLDTNERRL